MPHGLYQIFAGASHSHHLSRLLIYAQFSSHFPYLVAARIFKSLKCYSQTRPALPALQQLVHSNDEEVLTDACWALSYLSDGTNDKIQAVIEAGVCQRLVELLL